MAKPWQLCSGVSVVLVWLHIIRFSFSKKASEEENRVLVIVNNIVN